jgi:uncharacterized protein (TIRG00374 family)
MQGMTKKRLFRVLKLLFTAAVLAVVIRQVNLREIGLALQNPRRPAYIFLAGAMLIPNLYLQWLRWHLLLRLDHPSSSASESAVSLFGGMVAAFVTPGRIGEVGRTLFLRQADRFQAIGLVVIDKLYAFFPVLVAGVWGIVLMLSYIFGYATFLFWPLAVSAFLISLATILIALHPVWIRTVLYNLSVMMPARDKIQRLIHCMDRFEGGQARRQLLLSCLLYCVYIVQFCLLAFAFQPIPWTTALTATTSTIFVKTILPISIGDLGIREGASVYFFMKFNVEKTTAFNSSLLLFGINVLVPTLIGLLFIPRMRLGGGPEPPSRR